MFDPDNAQRDLVAKWLAERVERLEGRVVALEARIVALEATPDPAPAPVMPKPAPKDSPGGAEAPVPEEETAARHWRELGPWKTLPIPPEAPVLKLRPATDVLTGLTPGIVDLLKEAQKPRPTPPGDDHIRALKERLAQQMPHAADEFSLAVTRRTLAGAFRALLRRARGRS